MKDIEALKTQIRAAFTGNKYPGRGNITNSYESDESASMEEVFAGKEDWTKLDADFLDLAPQGFASALSFFTHHAFRFYLPAYLIADIESKLMHTDVVFHLYHGLDEASRHQLINPRRYADMNWHDYATERFKEFTPQQAAAVVGFLEFKLRSGHLVDSEADCVKQALDVFWRGKAEEGGRNQ
jgi:hypothetical protein